MTDITEVMAERNLGNNRSFAHRTFCSVNDEEIIDKSQYDQRKYVKCETLHMLDLQCSKTL